MYVKCVVPGVKSEANEEVPYTCILSNVQQVATPLAAKYLSEPPILFLSSSFFLVKFISNMLK